MAVIGAVVAAVSAGVVQPAAADTPLACKFPGNRSAAARICAEVSGQIYGAFATWKNAPITFSNGAAVGDWVQNYMDMMPVPGTGFDMGLRSTKAGAVGRTYEPYWAENGNQSYQEHAITPARGPASADGLNHSYMVLRSGQTSQWDVLYDFNPVGRTALQSQGYTNGYNVQLETNNLRDTTIGEMEDRFQYLAPGDEWSRFDRTSVTTQVTSATCGTSSPPPYCFAAELTGSPKAIAWKVSKPAAVAFTAPRPQRGASAGATLNGVDQDALATCMANDPSQCLQQVPGLAACVHARLACNATAQQPAPRSLTPRSVGSTLTAEQTRQLAAVRFHTDATQIQVRPMTVASYDKAAGTQLGGQWSPDLTLWLATSTAETKSEKGGETHYNGLTAAYDPSSGQLLHAALGAQRPFK
ncbi:hypothetical protein ABZ726_07595 [Streptomyces hundungensis]|uniref:hypothetical protein n=1 Tax=Streptomyces hundungensis TaxID=1077946 RepID=UPI0033EB4B42